MSGGDVLTGQKNLAKSSAVADNGTKGILSGGTEIMVEGIQTILDVADMTGFSGTEQT